MKIRTLITFLACYALNSHALPIVFSGTQFETSTAAIAGAQADAEFDSSPPSALPLVTSATAVGASDFASGNAIAASGLLATSAEASSVAGLASGVGTAEFVGTFTGGGLLGIALNFNTQIFTDTTGFSAATLFLQLISNNVTLLNEIVSASGLVSRTVNVPFGTNNTFNLLLSSEASITVGGNASNFALVSFQLANNVREPPIWLLMLPGLLLLVRLRRNYGEKTSAGVRGPA